MISIIEAGSRLIIGVGRVNLRLNLDLSVNIDQVEAIGSKFSADRVYQGVEEQERV